MKPISCCPFCQSNMVSSVELDERQWSVVCNTCKATGPQMVTEQEAIARWESVSQPANGGVAQMVSKLFG